ncbi:MAG: hypothetical protein GYA55_07635 [SAR324 cluster bacterium]|uniref:4Fe4S-binding SPASM domain-containing protein n=1 Tax=SAR324 cluster bacterium TaxID=2024889 RepID=A0A7X9IJU8_9DELT|nr:hypothetical protein [SAR324 cluster bacterium]
MNNPISPDYSPGKMGNAGKALIETFSTSLSTRDRIIAKLLRLTKDIYTVHHINEDLMRGFTLLEKESRRLYHRRRLVENDKNRFSRILSKTAFTDFNLIRNSLFAWQHHMHLVNDALTKISNHVYKLLPRPVELEEAFRTRRSTDLDYEQIRLLNAKLLFAEMLLSEPSPHALAPTVNIDPSNGCNARCRTCYQCMDQNYPHSVLNQDITRKMDRVLPFTMDLKLFGVGEATLSPALQSLILLCNLHKCPGNLLTNGSTLGTEEQSFGTLTSLGISIDAVDPRIYKALRPTIPLNELIKKMKNFHFNNSHVSLYLNVTINRVNLYQIVPLTKLAEDVGASRINFTRFISYLPHHPPLRLRKSDETIFSTEMKKAESIARQANIFIDNAVIFDDFEDNETLDENKILEELEQVAIVGGAPSFPIKDALDLLEKSLPLQCLPGFMGELSRCPEHEMSDGQQNWISTDPSFLQKQLAERIEKIKSLPPSDLHLPYCLSPWTKLYVESDGTLRPCCVMGEMIGDLNEAENIEEAWNDPAFVKLRAGTLGLCPLPPTCESCSFAERYLLIDMVLNFLDDLGINLRCLKLPKNFEPPERIKTRLGRNS